MNHIFENYIKLKIHVNHNIASQIQKKFTKYKDYINIMTQKNNIVDLKNVVFHNEVKKFKTQIEFLHQSRFDVDSKKRSIKISKLSMFFEKNKILIRFFLFVTRHKIRVNANHFKKRIQYKIDLNKIDYCHMQNRLKFLTSNREIFFFRHR